MTLKLTISGLALGLLVSLTATGQPEAYLAEAKKAIAESNNIYFRPS